MKPGKKKLQRFKIARRFAVILAAAPLFQLAQCQTFGNQLSVNFLNSLPSTAFSVLFNFALLPIQILLGGGQVTGNGTGTGGGI